MTSFPVVWVMMTSSIIHLPSEWVISMKIWSCRKKTLLGMTWRHQLSSWWRHRRAGISWIQLDYAEKEDRNKTLKKYRVTTREKGGWRHIWLANQRSTQIGICVGVILSLRTNQWWPCKTHATHNTQKEPKVTWVPSRVEFWRHRWVYYIKYILESISNSWRHHTGQYFPSLEKFSIGTFRGKHFPKNQKNDKFSKTIIFMDFLWNL